MSKPPSDAARKKIAPSEPRQIDREWHLAHGVHGVAVTEFEYAAMQLIEAFNRWNVQCNACASGEFLNQPDVSILHVIRMKDRPKSLSEIGNFLNRDDSANIQYSLRKLERSGYIRKLSRASKRQTSYVVTDKGRAATDAFAGLRDSVLLPLTEALRDSDVTLDHATKTMQLMIGIYDMSARMAASYRQPAGDEAAPEAPAARRTASR